MARFVLLICSVSMLLALGYWQPDWLVWLKQSAENSVDWFVQTAGVTGYLALAIEFGELGLSLMLAGFMLLFGFGLRQLWRRYFTMWRIAIATLLPLAAHIVEYSLGVYWSSLLEPVYTLASWFIDQLATSIAVRFSLFGGRDLLETIIITMTLLGLWMILMRPIKQLWRRLRRSSSPSTPPTGSSTTRRSKMTNFFKRGWRTSTSSPQPRVKKDRSATAITPLMSYIYCGLAVLITALPLFGLWLLVLVLTGSATLMTMLLALWASLIGAASLLMLPKAQVSGYTDKETQVPVNHAGVITWLGRVIDGFYLTEGWPLIPWWLGFGISTAPVARTIVQFHDDKGNPLAPEDRGHYTDGEKNGFVYMGERLIQEVVKVQADDLVEVTGDYNSTEKVVNPAVWQRAGNPLGTIIGRQEATLRTGISYIHAEDVNGVRSLFPSMMERDVILLLRVKGDSRSFVTGDLIRSESGRRLVKKVDYREELGNLSGEQLKKVLTTEIHEYLDEVSRVAADACVPEDGFSVDDVQALNIAAGLYEEIERVGGQHVDKSASIKDFTLPQPVGNAAQKVAIERREQVAEIIQAETVDQVAQKHADSIKNHGMDAVEVALAEREKAKMVIGRGENPIAQALAGLNKD